MFPLPIIFNTNINQVSQLQRLEDEITSSKMLKVTAEAVSIVPQSNPYVYSRGISSIGINQLNGSPYGYQTPTDSNFSGIFRHCFPNDTIFNQYMQDPTLPSYLKLYQWNTYSDYPAVTRNGLTSIAYFKPYAGVRYEQFVYYDKATGIVMQYNPYLKTTPTPKY